MIDTPRIVQTQPRLFASLHLRIPKAEIRRAMGPGLQEVYAAVAAQGLAPAGPWLTHHLRIDPAEWDFEIGVPIARAIAPSGRVRTGEWPASRVARATLHGDYDGLASAWGELDAWVAVQGLRPSAELWEVYTLGPEANPDPGAWRTELSRPVLGA